MRKLLLDVNVVLDVLLDRAPFASSASALWAAAEQRQIEAFVPAHGVTTVFYLAARQRGAAFARRVVADLLIVPRIARVDGPVLRRALGLGWDDLEDAVCAAAAETAGCDLLVTRDPRGFRQSPVLVVDAPTAVSLVGGGSGPGAVGEQTAVAYGSSRRRRTSRTRFDRAEA